MSSPIASFADTSAGVRERVCEAIAVLAGLTEAPGGGAATQIHALVDDELIAVTGLVEALGRTVDALRTWCAAEVVERSPKGAGSERLSARSGCRTPAELIARVTRVSEATASRRASLGAAVLPRGALSGEVLSPTFPATAEAMASGLLGDDAARVIVAALGGGVRDRADADDWAAAEAALVADAVAGFTADQTRVQAAVWRVALDPDGVDTDAQEAMRRRGLVRLGTRGGLVRYRMELMPEISGKLETALAAVVSPKTSLCSSATMRRWSGARTTNEPRRRNDMTRSPRSSMPQRGPPRWRRWAVRPRRCWCGSTRPT